MLISNRPTYSLPSLGTTLVHIFIFLLLLENVHFKFGVQCWGIRKRKYKQRKENDCMEKLSLIFFWLNSIAAALFYSAFRSLELYDYNYIYIAHRHTTVAK